MSNLTLTPIDDIYAELDSRLPNYILISIRPGRGPEYIQVKMQGSQTMCLGMMDAVSNRIRNSISFSGGLRKD
jgi:hypothetical protein